VEWNFQKYLVDRSGRVVGRFHHRTKPLSPEVVNEIERVLAAK
jgi:glutathione peroxidase